jgi:Golgi nucleoside diphosphatase
MTVLCVLAVPEHRLLCIADLGSSGTRMYLYDIEAPSLKKQNTVPMIKTKAVFKNNTKGISAFIHNPEEAARYLLDLIHPLMTHTASLRAKTAQKTAQLHQPPLIIHLFATAGMRTFTVEKQAQLYQALEHRINHEGARKADPFKFQVKIKTITGELEGVFAWLSVNYDQKTFQEHKQSVGIFDLGGQSTQIAFELPVSESKTTTVYPLKIGDTLYAVYSRSLLNYGINSIYDNVQSNADSNSFSSCLSYNQDQFQYKGCKKVIQNYLESHPENQGPHLHALTYPLKIQMKFIGLAGYHYYGHLFNVQDFENLPLKVSKYCRWNRFSETHHDDKACFGGTYLDVLLHDIYHIPENYQQISAKRGNPSWTLGAALYISTYPDALQSVGDT